MLFPQFTSKAYGAKALGDGIVELYVSVFNAEDSYRERVAFGAFKESIATKLPKAVWQHDITRPIGKTLEATEIEAGSSELPDEIKEYGGLKIKAHLNTNTTDGKDAYEHIKFGSIDEYSFGYELLESKNLDDGTIELTKLRIHEWSPVTIGANPLTMTSSVKSYDVKGDELEQLITDFVGHSKAKCEMRTKEGRTLSSANRERIRSIADALKVASEDLGDMYKATEPKPKGRQTELTIKKLRLRVSELSINEIN